MNIKCVVTGYLDENCYVLSKNGTCLIVDPGDDFIKIKSPINIKLSSSKKNVTESLEWPGV